MYKKGARKEYKIIKDLKQEGFDIAQRTAGSHSQIDIIAINVEEKIIKLIQSKRTLSETMNYINPKIKAKIEKENKKLNGIFEVKFEVR